MTDRPTAPMMTASPATWPTGYYVMDDMALTIQDAYISGPWPCAGSAEDDRQEYNTAGDLGVYRHLEASTSFTRYTPTRPAPRTDR